MKRHLLTTIIIAPLIVAASCQQGGERISAGQQGADACAGYAFRYSEDLVSARLAIKTPDGIAHSVILNPRTGKLGHNAPLGITAATLDVAGDGRCVTMTGSTDACLVARKGQICTTVATK